MFKRFYLSWSAWSSAPSRTVGGAALLIASAGIASRFFGFLRDRILASRFGAGDTLDAYYAAFRIPDLMYSLLVLGALSAAFIPVFTELLSEDQKERAWKLASGVLNLLLLSIGALALGGELFAPHMTAWLAPGFSPQKQAMTTLLTRIMLFSPIILGASALVGGVLVSFKQFAAYSVAPIFYNLGIILGALALVPLVGPIGLAWGVVCGSFLHLAIQYPSFRRAGFRYVPPRPDILGDHAVRKVFHLMIPRTIGMAVSQVSLVVITIFASLLASGSLAVFTLANNIQSVPLGLFGIPFSLAVFPALALAAARREEGEFFTLLSSTTRRILFFVLPISVLVVIFRAQFVRVILGAGQFDWEDTIRTFDVLKFLAVSLFAQSLIPLFSRAFYALQNTKTPLYVALASEAVNIALVITLTPRLAVEGLAIAFSAASVVNFLLLYVLLRRELRGWRDRDLLVPAVKIIFASLCAGVVAQLSKRVFALTTSELDTFVKVFLQLLVGLAIGGSSFLLFARWLKIEEFRIIRRFFLRNVLRQPETAVFAEDHPERGEW